jgi:PAS domain S-box-containing protein
MSTSSPHQDRPSLATQADNPRERLLFSGLVTVTGLAMALAHVPHLIADLRHGHGVLAMLAGAIGPMVLALALSAVGVLVWRYGVPADKIRRIILWGTWGTVGITGLGGMVFLYQLLEGAEPTHLLFVMLNFATAGAIIGTVIGWYDSERSLRAEHLRAFQQAVEQSGHSIYLTDTDGTIEYVNPAFEHQTGYEREEAIGATPSILKSGEMDEAFFADLWETITEGELWDSEIINAHADGETYPVDQTIAPIINEEGTIERFVAINSDISERKAYEEQLERQNEQLEEFASVVSHDLRNPLNVATSRLKMARESHDNDNLAKASQSLERMEELIEDVLTLAREGQNIDEREPLSLEAVASAAWDSVATEDAHFETTADVDLEGDQRRLQRMLENLFRNSIDHGLTNGESDSLTLRVGPTDDGFFVEDDGTGLPDTSDEDLFESGFTTDEDGNGLGLAIVERIADAHDWSVSACDSETGGARFEISLDEAAG